MDQLPKPVWGGPLNPSAEDFMRMYHQVDADWRINCLPADTEAFKQVFRDIGQENGASFEVNGVPVA